MKPDREMVSRKLIDFRKPILENFNRTVNTERQSLTAASYEPVKLLYSEASIMFSEKSYKSIMGVEEVFLRNHIPYGFLPAYGTKPLTIPFDCEVLVIANQNCLSDNDTDAIVKFAQKGGKTLIIGESGWHDQLYRQRYSNPLLERLEGIQNVQWLNETEFATVKDGGWTLKVGKPGEAGQRLLESLEKFWSPEIRIDGPETVFVNIKKADETTYYIHFLNYAPESVSQGIRIAISGKDIAISEASVARPMDNKPKEAVLFGSDSKGMKSASLPGFDKYALVALKTKSKSD